MYVIVMNFIKGCFYEPCENVLCVIIPQGHCGRSADGNPLSLSIVRLEQIGACTTRLAQKPHWQGDCVARIVSSIHIGSLPVNSAICFTSGKTNCPSSGKFGGVKKFFCHGSRSSPSTVMSPYGTPAGRSCCRASSFGIQPLFTSTFDPPSPRSRGVTTRNPFVPSCTRGPISISWSCLNWPVV